MTHPNTLNKVSQKVFHVAWSSAHCYPGCPPPDAVVPFTPYVHPPIKPPAEQSEHKSIGSTLPDVELNTLDE